MQEKFHQGVRVHEKQFKIFLVENTWSRVIRYVGIKAYNFISCLVTAAELNSETHLNFQGTEMLKLFFITLFSIITFSSHALKSNIDIDSYFAVEAEIYAQQSCFRAPFESYDSWLGMMQRSMKKSAKNEDDFNRRFTRFNKAFPFSDYKRFGANLECITFKYKVDTEEVQGYLIRPKGNQKLPVIVYNRGGNGNYGSMVFGALMYKLMPLAEKGFVIVGSQYRGTFQPDGMLKDEFGGDDIEDVVTLVNKLKYLKHANTKAIGMYGHSRGSMQSLIALKQLDKIVKAVVLRAGVHDLKGELTFRPEMESVYERRIPNYATEKEALLRARSALYWSSEIETSIPILLQHGDNDKRVSVYNSKALAEQFSQTNRPHKLSIYVDDDHGLSKHKQEGMNEISNWFNEYLK